MDRDVADDAVPCGLGLVAVGMAFIADWVDHAVIDADGEVVSARAEAAEGVGVAGAKRVLGRGGFGAVDPDAALPHHAFESELDFLMIP